jgi:hypothetical protein
MRAKPIESFKNTIENYAEVSKAAAFVRDQPRPGPVMVFETPLIDNLSGREQATPVHGFIWHWVPRRQHEKSVAILNATPPPFVFVGSRYEELVRLRTPAVMELLAERYRIAWQSPFGRWYELADQQDSPGVHDPGSRTEGKRDPGVESFLALQPIGNRVSLPDARSSAEAQAVMAGVGDEPARVAHRNVRAGGIGFGCATDSVTDSRRQGCN